MSNQYDISIMIAFVQEEEWFEECLSNVINNTQNVKSEIILVERKNASEKLSKIATEAANKHENVIFVKSQESLASTRNSVMKMAKGKYFMPICPSDIIGEHTVSDLVSFFDQKKKEVDLITYAAVFKDAKEELSATEENEDEEVKHGFEEEENETPMMYKHSGVYALKMHAHDFIVSKYFVVKTNINNISYDDSLTEWNSIWKYQMDVLFDKKQVAHCVCDPVKTYMPVADDSEISRYAIYSYDESAKLYKSMIDKYAAIEDVFEKRFIESLVLREMDEMVKVNNLFSDVCKKKYPKAYQTYQEILTNLDQRLLNKRCLTRPQRFYYRTFQKERYSIKNDDVNYALYFENEMLTSWRNYACFINYFKLENGIITVRGTFQHKAGIMFDPEFYVTNTKLGNDSKKVKKLKLKPSTRIYSENQAGTAKTYAFDYSMPVEQGKFITFLVKINGILYPIALKSSPNMPHGLATLRKKSIIGNFVISVGGGRITREYFNKIKMQKRYLDEKEFYTEEASDEIVKMRNNIRKETRKTNRNINLYIGEYKDTDAAYQLYCSNQLSQTDEIHYFMSKSKINAKLDTIFSIYDEKAYYVFSIASRIYTSEPNFKKYCPFNEEEVLLFSDVWNAEVIFVPNQIDLAIQPWKYAFEFTGVDKVMLTSGAEEELYINEYGYLPEQIMKYTPARLEDKDESGNSILFAPGARDYVICEGRVHEDAFFASKAFEEYRAFLENDKLVDYLEETDKQLDVYLGEEYRMCSSYFKSFNASDRIHIITSNPDLYEYNLCIGDYSPIANDFRYIDKPVINFIPDLEEIELTMPYVNVKSIVKGEIYTNAKQIMEQIKKIK